MTNLNTTEPQFTLPLSNCPRCSSNLSLNKATGDIACGMNAYSLILEALIKKEFSGKGSAIKISLFESLSEWMLSLKHN